MRWIKKWARKSSKRAPLWIFTAHFYKFWAFRTLHPHKRHFFLEVLVENKPFYFSKRALLVKITSVNVFFSFRFKHWGYTVPFLHYPWVYCTWLYKANIIWPGLYFSLHIANILPSLFYHKFLQYIFGPCTWVLVSGWFSLNIFIKLFFNVLSKIFLKEP